MVQTEALRLFILRINDKQGVDKEGEQSLPGQVILSMRTIKPDGEILEPEHRVFFSYYGTRLLGSPKTVDYSIIGTG